MHGLQKPLHQNQFAFSFHSSPNYFENLLHLKRGDHTSDWAGLHTCTRGSPRYSQGPFRSRPPVQILAEDSEPRDCCLFLAFWNNGMPPHHPGDIGISIPKLHIVF